jgi:hypothetical protein
MRVTRLWFAVCAGCSEDFLESEGFAGGDFSNDVDDPNDSESDGDGEDGEEASI